MRDWLHILSGDLMATIAQRMLLLPKAPKPYLCKVSKLMLVADGYDVLKVSNLP
jgi:hypothetical protein